MCLHLMKKTIDENRCKYPTGQQRISLQPFLGGGGGVND